MPEVITETEEFVVYSVKNNNNQLISDECVLIVIQSDEQVIPIIRPGLGLWLHCFDSSMAAVGDW